MMHLLLATLLGAAPAPDAGPPPVILERPSPEELWGMYPERARAMGRSGEATLACGVTRSGSLAHCKVVSESPRGFGFGEAALRLSPAYRVRAEGSEVVLPIKFTPGDMPIYRP